MLAFVPPTTIFSEFDMFPRGYSRSFHPHGQAAYRRVSQPRSSLAEAEARYLHAQLYRQQLEQEAIRQQRVQQQELLDVLFGVPQRAALPEYAVEIDRIRRQEAVRRRQEEQVLAMRRQQQQEALQLRREAAIRQRAREHAKAEDARAQHVRQQIELFNFLRVLLTAQAQQSEQSSVPQPTTAAPVASPQSKEIPSLEDLLLHRAILESKQDTTPHLLYDPSGNAPSTRLGDIKGKSKAVETIPTTWQGLEDYLRQRSQAETDPDIQDMLASLIPSVFGSSPAPGVDTAKKSVRFDHSERTPGPSYSASQPSTFHPGESDSVKLRRSQAVSDDTTAKLRALHTRKRSLAAIADVRASFDSLTHDFAVPAHLDFSSPPSSTEQAPALAYSAQNRPLHVYEHALAALLSRLDAVESDGDEAVRTARRGIVNAVEAELNRVEREVEKQRGEWEASRPATPVETTEPTTFAADVEATTRVQDSKALAPLNDDKSEASSFKYTEVNDSDLPTTSAQDVSIDITNMTLSAQSDVAHALEGIVAHDVSPAIDVDATRQPIQPASFANDVALVDDAPVAQPIHDFSAPPALPSDDAVASTSDLHQDNTSNNDVPIDSMADDSRPVDPSTAQLDAPVSYEPISHQDATSAEMVAVNFIPEDRDEEEQVFFTIDDSNSDSISVSSDAFAISSDSGASDGAVVDDHSKAPAVSTAVVEHGDEEWSDLEA